MKFEQMAKGIVLEFRCLFYELMLLWYLFIIFDALYGKMKKFFSFNTFYGKIVDLKVVYKSYRTGIDEALKYLIIQCYEI